MQAGRRRASTGSVRCTQRFPHATREATLGGCLRAKLASSANFRMCSGAVLLYKIPQVVVGENKTFQGPEDYLRSRGVEVKVLNDAECIRIMREFIGKNPGLWNEDIGEDD